MNPVGCCLAELYRSSAWQAVALAKAADRRSSPACHSIVCRVRANPCESVANKVSSLLHKLRNLTHHPIELVDQSGMIIMLAKRGDKRAVIPKRSILFPRKPLEHFHTISSKLSQNRACVMQFVGR